MHAEDSPKNLHKNCGQLSYMTDSGSSWTKVMTGVDALGIDAIPESLLHDIVTELNRIQADKEIRNARKKKERIHEEIKRKTLERVRIREDESAERRTLETRKALKADKLKEWQDKLKERDQQRLNEKKEILSLIKDGLKKKRIPIVITRVVRKVPADRVPINEPIIPDVSIPSPVLKLPCVSGVGSYRKTFKRRKPLTQYKQSVQLASSIYSSRKHA